MEEVQDTRKVIKDVLSFISSTPWRGYYTSRIENMLERVDQPCELAIVGEVKAGKSSFLNALLGKDLAMVGKTEMTATINFFKYGQPKDDDHPVRVVWEDGSEEWQTRAFLDSLQGNTKEILDKASKIDHLEYFLEDEILRKVTLVDTPGTGSLVRDHEQRANEYLSAGKEQLRKKHNEQTINLKNRADAVILLTGRVERSSTNELITELSQNTSAFNTLGVMTKIDMEPTTTAEDWARRCNKYHNMLHQQLNTIVPVSANIYKMATTSNGISRLKELSEYLQSLPHEEGFYEEIFPTDNKGQILSINYFESEGGYNDVFNEYGLTIDIRKALANGYDWMVYSMLVNVLYHYSFNDAIRYLVTYSGMERMKEIIERQFLNRSRIIRCAKIANDLYGVLNDIRNRHLPSIKTDVAYRTIYLNIIRDCKLQNKDILQAFEKFVETHVCTHEQLEDYEKKIKELISEVECLLLRFEGTDKKSEALILLEKKQSSFLPSEYEELEILFGKYADKKSATDRPTVARRQAYWRSRKNSSSNAEVNKIIEMAVYAYGTIKTD